MSETSDRFQKITQLPPQVAAELLKFIEFSALHDCAGSMAERRLAAAVALCRPAGKAEAAQ